MSKLFEGFIAKSLAISFSNLEVYCTMIGNSMEIGIAMKILLHIYIYIGLKWFPMFPQNERDKVMYVKLSRLFLHGSYMCQQSSAWSATKPRSFVQLMGGGALTLKVPHGWLDSYYRARGLSRVFSKMRGSLSEKTKKKKKKKKRTVRIQQIFANFPARIQF